MIKFQESLVDNMKRKVLSLFVWVLALTVGGRSVYAATEIVCQKHVVVRTGQDFLDACKNKSDVYIIVEGNCDLSGQTVTIPDNSTLRFEGGCVANGTLKFNGCYVDGRASFDCEFSGEIVNDYVDLGWFGLQSGDSKVDNGQIINKVCTVFHNVHLPAGNYYFSTPIIIKDIRHLDFFGDLIYLGKENTSAISISGWSAVIDLNGSVSCHGNQNIDYSSKYNSNIVGLDFVNINNSKIYINSVSYFNENVRVSGVGYPGCCYNRFSLGLIRNANVGLRVYQNNSGNSIGWANENIFIGGRFTNFSDWKSDKWISYAVEIEGGDNDKYNGCNSLYFLKQSFEGFNTIVYAKNLQNSVFEAARTEGSKLFVKFDGDCKGNRISTSYQGSCVLYDETSSSMLALSLDNSPIYHVQTLNKEINSVLVDTRTSKMFRVKLKEPGRVMLTYLTDGNGEIISEVNVKQYGMPLNTTYHGTFYYNTTRKAILNGGDLSEIEFKVPENVTSLKIQIINSNQIVDVYSISESANIIEYQ